MIKEAMEWLRNNTRANRDDMFGIPYVEHPVTMVAPPFPPTIDVETLNAFAILSDMEIDGVSPNKCFVKIDSYSTVHLLAGGDDGYGRRRKYVSAMISPNPSFVFGKFYDPESFSIALHSLFVDTPELKRLIQLSSSLTAENVAIAEDDGISQTATFRAGIALKANKKIEPKIDLAPFRTFREVDQPESTFLFRLQSREESAPNCALFEADGGAWKLEAVANIAAWLRTHLPPDLKKSIVY